MFCPTRAIAATLIPPSAHPPRKLDNSQPQHIHTKSTPTLMIPRSEVERLLADTAVYEGKPLEQGRTSNRSGGETQHSAPEKKPRRNTETQNQPQKTNEPTTK